MERVLRVRRHGECYRFFMCGFPECDRPGPYRGGYCPTHYHQKRRSGEMWPIGSARSLSRVKGARSVEGCGHAGCDGDPIGFGYCRRHYGQFKRTGTTWDGARRPLPPMPPCGLEGCETPQRRGKTGLCDKHAQANARHIAAYGIDLFDRQRIFNEQEGRCLTCKNETELHLDHCHRTGKVRSLLCGNCNRALGLVAESPDTLRALLAYAERGLPS